MIERPINIIFGDMSCDFQNSNLTIKIDIQSEHTLVKLGGRSVDEIVYGDIDLPDKSGKYLIRIPNYDYYSKLDATIEYSLPNIANIMTNNRFINYLKRATYIAPLIYDNIDFGRYEKTHTITLFSGNQSDRRSSFSNDAKAMSLGMYNVYGIFDKDDMKALYKQTRIMVNVHQTDHHHTLEELRILPALCNGVIIVSEDVPLKDRVPYANAIVWSSYQDLAKTVQDVQNNYDFYYKKIFTAQLAERLIELQDGNIRNIHRLIGR